MDETRQGPSLLRRLVAIVVLALAAWILLKLVFGLVAAVAWAIAGIALIVAVIWALRQL
jgi:hypothetical protein